MNQTPLYKIFPLGDSAITVEFGNGIDPKINQHVIGLFEKISEQPFEGMIEAVPAYSSLTIYFDIISLHKKSPFGKTVQDNIKSRLEEFLSKDVDINAGSSRFIRIPVCYEGEFAPDLPWLAKEKNISIEEVVEIHTLKTYRVYMLGFLPGFAYMGKVNEKIAVPRKQQPQNIMAGSIGIAGKQTGIYPLNSPGGWQIIGRTPLKIFAPDKIEITLLKAGDTVEFFSITKNEFADYQTRDT